TASASPAPRRRLPRNGIDGRGRTDMAGARASAPVGAGIGLRLPHLNEVAAARPRVPWFEVHPENFIANPHATELLESVRADYPISIHTVGVSIGSVGGVDRDHIAKVRALIDRIDPFVVSGHL